MEYKYYWFWQNKKLDVRQNRQMTQQVEEAHGVGTEKTHWKYGNTADSYKVISPRLHSSGSPADSNGLSRAPTSFVPYGQL